MPASSPDLFRLDGQSVLITGAGGGIGAALVERFTAAGARVFGADRNTAALTHLQLTGELTFDLADLSATEAAASNFIDTTGVPDIVVSNAGFTRAETLDDLDVSVWESELAINLNGVYALLKPIVAAMSKRRSGSSSGTKGRYLSNGIGVGVTGFGGMSCSLFPSLWSISSDL